MSSSRSEKSGDRKKQALVASKAPRSLTETDVRKVITDELHQRTESLYGDPQYADLTIKCGDRVFQVHKAVVCPSSDVFFAACKKNDQGGFKEGFENTIPLSDDVEDGGDDPAAIAWMLEYIYKSDYFITNELIPNSEPAHTTQNSPLRSHAQVFAAAEKYKIKGLKLLAEYKFKTQLAKSGVSIPDLATAIRVTFTSTVEEVSELRAVLKEFLVKAGADVTSDSEVRNAVESIEGLPFELFQMLKQKMPIVDAEPVGSPTYW